MNNMVFIQEQFFLSILEDEDVLLDTVLFKRKERKEYQTGKIESQ